MQIATTTGDDGCTDIIGGRRLPKDHPIVECLGTLDELNAFLGGAKASLGDSQSAHSIDTIQHSLFTLMSVIAGAPVPPGGLGEEYLNGLIDELESGLPSHASFAVPGADPVSAQLHIARAVCRRAERRIVSLDLTGETRAAVAPYMNRLSDLLFLLAERETLR